MTIHEDLMLRQIELEIEMAGLGADKFKSRVTKDIAKERGATRNPGSYLVGKAIRPMSEAITKFVDDAYSGRPGPRAVAARLIKDMDKDVVAFLAVRSILNSLMKGGSVPLLTISRQVANSIEAEARFSAFAAQAPGLYARVSMNLEENGSSEHHKAMVLTYAMNKFDIPWDIWSQTDKMHLGIKMVDLFIENTGFAELIQAYESENRRAARDQYRVSLTAITGEWIGQSIDRGMERWPEYMPTIIPPKDWTGLTGGGYHSNAIRPLPLVKKVQPAHTKLLEKAHLGVVYSSLNAIQSTPWQINGAILEVMQQLYKAGSDTAGMVPNRELDLPEKPADIDINEQAKREWKWAARDVHAANIQRRRDLMQQQTLLDLATKFRDESAIYFPHNLDFRGRAYPVPQVLHPQGADNVKAMLRFAEGKPLGPDGERWLAIHGANTFGVDKVSFDKRVQWVEDNWRNIKHSAMDPIGHLWWTEADKPWCFLAFCMEWEQFKAWPDGFVSHLPIALDGSCNGLQHFSAMLLDPIGGAAVNLIPAPKPQDIYQRVADQVLAELRLYGPNSGTDEQKQRWAHEWLHFGIDRKVTKRPVMVLPYGGTPRSCVKYVEEEIMSRINGGQPHNFGGELKPAIAWLSGIVWNSIGAVVVAARDAMDWLQKLARVVASKNKPLHWTAPSGFVAYQDYRDMRLSRIRTILAGAVIKPGVYTETETINKSKQATSVSPNVVHSLDAAAMMLTVAQMASLGVSSFAMIHDSYATHACDTRLLSECLRDQFVKMYKTDPLKVIRDQVVRDYDWGFRKDRKDPTLLDELPPLPNKGNLNLEEILNSDFFFA